MSPEVIQQFQQIVATMKRVIEASGELAEKVDALDQRSNDTLAALNGLHGDLQALLSNYEKHAKMQTAVAAQLADAVARLESRVATLEMGSLGHMSTAQ
jgi:hypothetical protein